MASRFELSKARIEVVLYGATQPTCVNSRMIWPQHLVRESTEPQWIVVGPGHGQPERLGELLQIDHGRSSVNSDRFTSIKQFSCVASGAGDPEYDFLLPRVRIHKAVIPGEAYRQTIRVLPNLEIGNEAKSGHISVTAEWRRTLQAYLWLF